MKLIKLCLMASFLVVTSACQRAPKPVHVDQVGDQFEISIKQTSGSSGDGSSGSSTTRNTLIERVLSLHEDGIELEYDLDASISEEDRRRQWIYPVNVFRSWEGNFHLTNEPEMESRLEDWLEAGGLDRSACGKWFFTWTAIKIECDPQAGLETVSSIDMREQNITVGAPYTSIGALGASKLREKSDNTLTAELPVDPEMIRAQRAVSNMVTAEVMGDEVPSFEIALERLASEEITGTMTVTFKLNSESSLAEKVIRTSLVIQDADGEQERLNTRTILSRSLIGGPSFEDKQIQTD